MKTDDNNWNVKVIRLIEKRITTLKTDADLEMTPRQIRRELERLENLKSVVENSTQKSFIYQRDKLNANIRILNKRYDTWLNADKARQSLPNSRSTYNSESGLNHLRKQRRNVEYILELDKDEK